MRFPPIDLDIITTKPAVEVSRWGASLFWLDLRFQASDSRGFEMLLTSNVGVPATSDKVPVTSGAEHVDIRVLQFGSVSPSPDMSVVGAEILANQSTSLAEFD